MQALVISTFEPTVPHDELLYLQWKVVNSLRTCRWCSCSNNSWDSEILLGTITLWAIIKRSQLFHSPCCLFIYLFIYWCSQYSLVVRPPQSLISRSYHKRCHPPCHYTWQYCCSGNSNTTWLSWSHPRYLTLTIKFSRSFNSDSVHQAPYCMILHFTDSDIYTKPGRHIFEPIVFYSRRLGVEWNFVENIRRREW